MNATIVDLRYKTKQILAALERRETVSVMYHGTIKATLVPVARTSTVKVQDSAFFGMKSKERQTVVQVMDGLRGGRHLDL